MITASTFRYSCVESTIDTLNDLFPGGLPIRWQQEWLTLGPVSTDKVLCGRVDTTDLDEEAIDSLAWAFQNQAFPPALRGLARHKIFFLPIHWLQLTSEEVA